MLLLNAEHFLLCASAILFPPIFFIVIAVIILASFGTSFELREKYVHILIQLFEWGASQVKDIKDAEGEDEKLYWNPSFDLDKAQTSDREECIIHREAAIPSEMSEEIKQVDCRGWEMIRDSTDFLTAGIEAIIEDEVTSRFKAKQLAIWNMLTRTSVSFYQPINWKLSLLWAFGFFFRYAILLPLRLILFAIGLIFLLVSTAVIGVLPENEIKKKLNEKCMLICHRVLSRSFTSVVRFHNPENKAYAGGICVANHTSPIDVLFLGLDNTYALVGQQHTGLLGVTQRALSRSSSHIWFERSEAKDRALVAARLKQHVEDSTKLPILIFPEGTCINNTSVMMFKKGCFEVSTVIYPIAMKYDPLFGDAFWNSSEQGWCEYLLRMMTSWAIICDVWYLPPMSKLPNENAIDFANRVKRQIAICGGLVDLEWDGGLKRSKVPQKMVENQQEKYAKRLSRYSSCSEPNAFLWQKMETKSSISDSKSDSTLYELDDGYEDAIDDNFTQELMAHEAVDASEVFWQLRGLEASKSSQIDAESGVPDLNSSLTTSGCCDDDLDTEGQLSYCASVHNG